jgi:hypothetical protein
MIAKSTFALGGGVTHVVDIVGAGNLASNNTGPILAWDFFLPIVMIGLYVLSRPARDRAVVTPNAGLGARTPRVPRSSAVSGSLGGPTEAPN